MRLILLHYSESTPHRERASWYDRHSKEIGLARSRFAPISLAHELGHMALGHDGAVWFESPDTPECNLEKELQAWLWAFRRRLPPNRGTRSFVRFALGGYERQCAHPGIRALAKQLRAALKG